MCRRIIRVIVIVVTLLLSVSYIHNKNDFSIIVIGLISVFVGFLSICISTKLTRLLHVISLFLLYESTSIAGLSSVEVYVSLIVFLLSVLLLLPITNNCDASFDLPVMYRVINSKEIGLLHKEQINIKFNFKNIYRVLCMNYILFIVLFFLIIILLLLNYVFLATVFSAIVFSLLLLKMRDNLFFQSKEYVNVKNNAISFTSINGTIVEITVKGCFDEKLPTQSVRLVVYNNRFVGLLPPEL